jgi:succinate dehydrogenase/fumarate reductase cytochrome b subunit
MHSTLIRTVTACVPACLLFIGSAVLFFRVKTGACFLQLLGTGCLMVVVLAHICEAVRVFPWMHWGEEHSAGHYLDLASAMLGLTLFPVGYFLLVVGRPRA